VTLRGTALFIAIIIMALAPASRTQRPQRSMQRSKRNRRNCTTFTCSSTSKRDVLGAAEAKVGTIAEQLAIANRNIASVQGQIAFLDAKMHTTEANLAWTKVQLDAAQKTLARHNDALRRRLIQAYEYGDLGYLAVLLQARSFGDFSNVGTTSRTS